MKHRIGIRVVLAVALAAAIVAAYAYRDGLNLAALAGWVRNAGAVGPLVHIAAYAVATVLFLPGSVLTLAGGALFGPVAGTLYSLTGATLGATGAFLIARYLASDWVQRQAGGWTQQLIEGVAQEGWRFIAFVRLVPLFPFNLLNYALGLTRLRLLVFVAGSYAFMFPGALAYTYLGYVGREAVTGSEGLIQKGLLALALLSAVAFLPRLIKRLRGTPTGRISSAALKQRLDRGDAIAVLDVRPAKDYRGELGNIAGSLNIPIGELPERLSELDAYRERPLAVVCRTNRMSGDAVQLLRDSGFKQALLVEDGMLGWNRIRSNASAALSLRRPSRRTLLIVAAVLGVSGFLAWRFLRPMVIFVVSPAFERPVETGVLPASFATLRASDCGRCHAVMYQEWQATVHARAWTDPYFQVDWRFDGAQQVCRNCHTPLDRQQEQRVRGFRDREKLDPILAPNPDFDSRLQHEGVTCAACHLRDGKILGPYGNVAAPHPIQKIADTNEICVRCHVVQGTRWDTFYRYPPCGTAAEIAVGENKWRGRSGEYTVGTVRDLGCVQCHMPLVERPLVNGGEVRAVRRHLWRGGHDPAAIASALDATLSEVPSGPSGKRAFLLTLTNVGAAHFLPTGTPDRHLTVEWRVLDAQGQPVGARREMLERLLMWRPFIIDLRDTRLPYRQPRTLRFEFARNGIPTGARLQVTVRYHLLHERRRERIGYANETPIAYPVVERTLALDTPVHAAAR